MHKYILGWIDIIPGKRDEFFAAIGDFVAKTRAEPGCLFFEMSPGRDSPDRVLLMECFVDEAAHELHSGLAHQVWMSGHMKKYMTEGKFELVYSDQVKRVPPRRPAE